MEYHIPHDDIAYYGLSYHRISYCGISHYGVAAIDSRSVII